MNVLFLYPKVLKPLFALFLGVAGWLLVLPPVPAEAVALRFESMRTRHSQNATIGEAQIWVDVAPAGEGQAWFRFHNDGPLASCVTWIHFDGDILSRLVEVDDAQPGVRYGTNRAFPRNLPGAARFGFSPDFSIGPRGLAKRNGVNPGEEVGVLFSLKDDMDYTDLLDAITVGQLRIGLKAQAFSRGGSEAFCSAPPAVPAPVPEPATLLLLGSGLVGLAVTIRKKKHVKEAESHGSM